MSHNREQARWHDEFVALAKDAGYEVVDWDGVSYYQGWGVLLLNRSGSWAVLDWNYGSCSGCDPYEDLVNRPNQEDFTGLLTICETEDQARSIFKECESRGW